MSKIADGTFVGASGTRYDFTIYTSDTSFKNFGAVYAFSKIAVKDSKGSHELLYIGETKELGDRIANHEKWFCVTDHGCNCICVHADDNNQSRLDKESDLIRNADLPCND
jgi:hypothetical protein